jgi:hypothetical protein
MRQAEVYYKNEIAGILTENESKVFCREINKKNTCN